MAVPEMNGIHDVIDTITVLRLNINPVHWTLALIVPRNALGAQRIVPTAKNVTTARTTATKTARTIPAQYQSCCVASVQP
jgi:hypothetical protein